MKNIKQINGVPCVLGKVHMLATEDGVIFKNRATGTLVMKIPNIAKKLYPAQHLYFTNDEEIKEGDSYLDTQTNTVYRCDSHKESLSTDDFDEFRKIIATTDPKLTTCKDGKDDKGFRTFKLNIIPQPSQAFIKAYCEQGGIDEVDVEYEYRKVWDKRTEELLEKYLLLKVDTIHNTITTHRIIEKMYSIDDIEAYCDKYPNDADLGRAIRKLKYKQ